MKISIVGSGYVGLVTGACLAELGFRVILVDVVLDKVEKINKGISPVYEEGLDRMLRKNVGNGRLHATTHLEKAVNGTVVTFICVGTPSRKSGEIDLSQVTGAASAIGKSLKNKKGFHTVVVKSSVVPGTTENVVAPLLEKNSGMKAGKDFGVAMNPEFLREGRAVEDFMNPDRIVIGAMDQVSSEALERLYSKFRCPVLKTTPGTAEMIKYASNAMLATKISFVNEIGNLCKKLGIDTYEVAEGMGRDSRIGRQFLDSGIGYGGSCFPKDVRAISAVSRRKGISLHVLESVEDVNNEQPMKMIELLRKRMPVLRNKTVAVLGLSFKPGTDDIREAPSLRIVKALVAGGAKVKAHDPQAMENFKKVFRKVEYCGSTEDALESADACLLLTEWPEYKELEDSDFKQMRGKIIIEGRRILDSKKVKKFEGICW